MEYRLLCKGKRVDNGEWVCGHYIATRKDDHIIYEHDFGMYESVDPETVCQCTGITDKNNQLIFEMDIVERQISKTPCAKGTIEWDNVEATYYAKTIDEDGCCADWNMADVHLGCVIIGNVYDNPELMAVGRNTTEEGRV
jgi:uncharacterized phage protein (TIGR01671 family)